MSANVLMQKKEVATINTDIAHKESDTASNSNKQSNQILTLNKFDPKCSRKDQKGIMIIKGKKGHKLTFKDQLDMKFYQVVEVESYKSFNIDISKGDHGAGNDNVSCACILI
jgi:hypothetical protein